MNSESDKKSNRLTLSRINVNHNKNKGANLYSNSIIYSNSNTEKNLPIWNNILPFISNLKKKHKKVVHFADEPLIFQKNNNKGMIKDKNEFKSFISNRIYNTEENENEKLKIKKRTKIEKLKKLKNFLINCHKKLKTGKYDEFDLKKSNEKEQNNDILLHNNQFIKPILKDNNNKKKVEHQYQINLIDENQVITTKKDKNIEANNINNKKENNQNNQNSLIKDLKNYCNEESNFSFCSLNDEKNTFFEELSISNDIKLEILSSYSNLNQISKGKYISDLYIQKKIKLKLKKYFTEKNNNEYILSLKSLELSSNSKKNKLTNNKKILKKSNEKKSKNKKSSKNKLIEKNSNSNAINLEKKTQLIKSNKMPTYKTDIIEKEIIPSSSIDGKILSNKITSKKDYISQSNNKNITFYTSFKNINEQNSIKTNKSFDHVNDNKNDIHSSFYSKKINKKKSQNDSFNFNINNNYTYNKSEAEIEINENLIILIIKI